MQQEFIPKKVIPHFLLVFPFEKRSDAVIYCCRAGLNLKKQSGFSPVELMVVIIILGILLGIGTAQFGTVVDRVQDQVEKISISSFRGIFEPGGIDGDPGK